MTRLRAPEQALYDALRGHLLRNLRLEQEKIGFAWVEAGLAALAAQPAARDG
ncbi:Wadjet anti-phage system protein JetD domain-containing protein [Roseateles sp. GG27B]